MEHYIEQKTEWQFEFSSTSWCYETTLIIRLIEKTQKLKKLRLKLPLAYTRQIVEGKSKKGLETDDVCDVCCMISFFWQLLYCGVTVGVKMRLRILVTMRQFYKTEPVLCAAWYIWQDIFARISWWIFASFYATNPGTKGRTDRISSYSYPDANPALPGVKGAMSWWQSTSLFLSPPPCSQTCFTLTSHVIF